MVGVKTGPTWNSPATSSKFELTFSRELSFFSVASLLTSASIALLSSGNLMSTSGSFSAIPFSVANLYKVKKSTAKIATI